MKYKVKVVAKPDPGNMTPQLPQANVKTPVNPENQKPPTLVNNPLPLEDASVCVSTPWPKDGKMSGNLFEIRNDWPIPPDTNTATTTETNPKPPVIKVEPQGLEQSNPSSIILKPEW